MKQVTIENVKARIAELEGADQLIGLGLHAEFELACLRQLVSCMEQQPFMYGIADPDGNAHMDEMCVSPSIAGVDEAVACLNDDIDEGCPLYEVVALYRHPVLPVRLFVPETDNTAQQFESLTTSAQRETAAVVKHYTGEKYPTLKFAQDEWFIIGNRDNAQELADAINALATSAGSGKP